MKNQYFFIAAFLLIANTINSQTQGCPQNINHPNLRTITQVVGSDTISREYILNIPQGYDQNNSTPLVINLHGFGDCASDYAESIGDFYDFSDLADQETIIVAYPQGAYRPDKEDKYWEPGDTGADDIFENDVYFIEQLIANISAEYNVNSDKIFACGYSNGGMMAYSLAGNRSNLFAAIGIMTGTMLEEDCTLSKPVPVIKFHGINDGVLPYNGSIWYQSVAEVVDFWLDKNDIPSGSLVSTEFGGGKVVKNEYSGNNSCLSLYTVNEEFDKPGDHVWFSEAIDGNTPNEIMWNFFKDNCRSTSSSVNTEKDVFSIYPNPVSDQFIINANTNEAFSIYTLTGKRVLTDRLNSTSKTIEISQLAAGVYLLKIGNQVQKLIKF